MVYVYDPLKGDWETGWLPPQGAMPYAPELRVGAFAGYSCSPILWTDKRLLLAYEALCAVCGALLPVRYAFRRIGEAPHMGQSAHYAGLALDIAHAPSQPPRQQLLQMAFQCGFDRVEPIWMTPGWLHLEAQVLPPASPRGGYPLLSQGDRGVHVFLLQDALTMLGFYHGGLTGAFRGELKQALARFQRHKGLPITGQANSPTWYAILRAADEQRQIEQE